MLLDRVELSAGNSVAIDGTRGSASLRDQSVRVPCPIPK
jgi:hypothetical protein